MVVSDAKVMVKNQNIATDATNEHRLAIALRTSSFLVCERINPPAISQVACVFLKLVKYKTGFRPQ